MPRPNDRRPGFSRKAQYGIFTGYLVAIVGIVIGALLLIGSLIEPRLFAAMRSGAAEMARPIGSASAGTRQAGQGLFGAIHAYFDAGRQNAALRREVDLARANALKMQALGQENARLKALLGVREQEQHPVATARFIGSTASSVRRFAILAAGTRAGIGTGDPVRSAGGLIGRVVEVGPDTARVLLVTDPDNVVPVRRASDGLPAMVQGSADGRVAIRLIQTGSAMLAKGDVFVTSGSGGIYPPGVPVAIVSVATRDGGTGLLATDPADAEFVIVEPVFQPVAVAALTAPTDAPSATASAQAGGGGHGKRAAPGGD